MRRRAVLSSVLAVAVSCGESPGAPTPDPGPGGPSMQQISLRVVSALQDQLGLAQVTVELPHGVRQQTDANGGVRINVATAGPVGLRLLHPDFVPRDTLVPVPSDGTVTVSLIPSSHDLVSFEEFAPRANGLQRWIRNPRMLVLTHAIDYGRAASGFREFPVVDRFYSQAQLDCIVSGMTDSLTDMSGGRLSWEAVEIAPVEPGMRVRIDETQEGTILVLPAISLGAGGRGTGYTGANPFVLTRGAVFFDSIVNFCVLSALYRHELGHALGYLHVTGRPSVMAPGSGALQEFDRNSIAIVFQRPPGNRSPDQDPSLSVNITAGPHRSLMEPMPSPWRREPRRERR